MSGLVMSGLGPCAFLTTPLRGEVGAPAQGAPGGGEASFYLFVRRPPLPTLPRKGGGLSCIEPRGTI